MATLYLGLGSNLGDRQRLLRQAVKNIERRIGSLISLSAFHETAPWGFSSPHPFLNAVVCVNTPLRPQEVLFITQDIERELGRTRKSTGTTYRGKTPYAPPPADAQTTVRHGTAGRNRTGPDSSHIGKNLP